MAKHVFIAGFEAFGGEKVNPSEMVARSLDGRSISGRSIVGRVLPVETRSLRERLQQHLREAQADIVIALAQARGRAALALERVAINVLDFEHADNVGVPRKGEPIVRGGPEARLTNFPFDRIIPALHENGVPAYVSNAAGTFIGNQLFYETLALTEHAIPPVIVGLVHLPLLPAQAIAAGAETMPSMSLELARKGIELIVETIVPWIDQRAPEPSVAREKGRQMWIPRGVKEVER